MDQGRGEEEAWRERERPAEKEIKAWRGRKGTQRESNGKAQREAAHMSQAK